ncbi:hypothetical protein [Pseudomonas sp. S2_H01]
MTFGHQTIYTDSEYLSLAGYGKVAMLPCIFDSRPGYHRLGSRFLIDRGLGLWEPKTHGAIPSVYPPSAKSLKNYAERLCNFLEWCEIRGLEYLAIEYSQDLIGKYQSEMLIGSWSRDGRALSERTINTRVRTAIEFLSWAADKGYREPLLIPESIKSYCQTDFRSCADSVKKVVVRKGKLRESKRRLGFPDKTELYHWLTKIYERPVRGEVDGLIAELILETAIRREEAACWRLDTLPLEVSDWKIANPSAPEEHQAVLVDLRFGTKGIEYGRDNGDKIGPRGTIRVPLSVALKLHAYRQFLRPKALALAVAKGRTLNAQKSILSKSVHLFLNPITGVRYTGDNIYDFWRYVDRPKGWSPHKARDYWACTLLWERMQRQIELIDIARQGSIDVVIVKALQLNVTSIIQLEIQPQLRHRSIETTVVYLQWVVDRLGFNLNLYESWSNSLEVKGDWQ